jgi:nucleoid DNA-binding protein
MNLRYLSLLIIFLSPILSASLNVSHSPKSLQDFSPDIVIQVGAFHHEANAMALKERLSDLLNNTIVIVSSEGYFKVRIIGFKNLEEIERLIPTLGLLGIKDLWVFRTKKEDDKSKVTAFADTSLKTIKDKDIKPQVTEPSDTSLTSVKDKIKLPVDTVAKPTTESTTINLQVGTFHSRSQALRAQRKIKSNLKLPVEIVKEWEYYIVFITGFKTREEIFKYYPKLAALGYPDSFMIDDNVVHPKDKKTK